MGFTKLKHILLHNITLALIISLPFIFIASNKIDKYHLNISEKINLAGTYKYLFYNDLDNNGKSDQIYFGENTLGDVYCKIYDPAHRGQHNTSSRFIQSYFSVFFYDITNDGIKEVLFLTQKDSCKLYLNILNYREEVLNEFEICEVGMPGKRDFYAYITHCVDLDLDGQKEILIAVNGGYALQPRAIYSFNPATKTVTRTPYLGSKLGTYIVDDIDNDNYPEIVCGTFTYQNYLDTTTVPYSDNQAWLFIFNHNLQFKIPPIEFSKKRSKVIPLIAGEGKNKMIYASIHYFDYTPKANKQFLITPEGKIVKTGLFVDGNANQNIPPGFFKANNKLIVWDSNRGNLYNVQPNLELQKLKHLPEYKDCFAYFKDLNNDGKKEIIFWDRASSIVTVTDHLFKHPVKSYSPGEYFSKGSFYFGHDPETGYLFHNKTGHYLLHYGQNRYWNFRFMLYAFIVGFIYLLLLVTNKIQSYKLKETLRAERELHELQYRAITSRFSPHYTFNVLNTLSAHIYDEKRPELFDFFNKFIRQLRYLYDDKNAVTRSLKDEITFCNDYLAIQKMRFPEKFEFKVNIGKELNQSVQIPKMMLHTFVENAFKHGLRSYDKGGLITMNIGRSGLQPEQRMPSLLYSTHKDGIPSSTITITITDNGIGRTTASSYAKQNPQFSSGRGLEMLHEFIALYNKYKKEKIEIITIDLYDGEKPAGTEVKIVIPV